MGICASVDKDEAGCAGCNGDTPLEERRNSVRDDPPIVAPIAEMEYEDMWTDIPPCPQGCPEPLFTAVHKHWERSIFKCPLGTRSADGRELSEDERILSDEFRAFVWHGYEKAGGHYVVRFSVRHEFPTDQVSRNKNFEANVDGSSWNVTHIAEVPEAP